MRSDKALEVCGKVIGALVLVTLTVVVVCACIWVGREAVSWVLP